MYFEVGESLTLRPEPVVWMSGRDVVPCDFESRLPSDLPGAVSIACVFSLEGPSNCFAKSRNICCTPTSCCLLPSIMAWCLRITFSILAHVLQAPRYLIITPSSKALAAKVTAPKALPLFRSEKFTSFMARSASVSESTFSRRLSSVTFCQPCKVNAWRPWSELPAIMLMICFVVSILLSLRAFILWLKSACSFSISFWILVSFISSIQHFSAISLSPASLAELKLAMTLAAFSLCEALIWESLSCRAATLSPLSRMNLASSASRLQMDHTSFTKHA
mmetsp:Transcript_167473/g.537807  ORF Transcript_167473/g.537807 Transcript_167473/m.537807 type:complete len:277 (+) Transcript_167473:180-1010(+)